QEGLRGRCSLQPPPPLDDEAEDALNSFLRERCDAVSNNPSIEADTTLTTSTDVGSTQTMAPAWHAGEVQEEETVAQGGGDKGGGDSAPCLCQSECRKGCSARKCLRPPMHLSSCLHRPALTLDIGALVFDPPTTI
ncbi:hypothetical protein HaLaN_30231, partial [Haematococcus lacustris]